MEKRAGIYQWWHMRQYWKLWMVLEVCVFFVGLLWAFPLLVLEAAEVSCPYITGTHIDLSHVKSYFILAEVIFWIIVSIVILAHLVILFMVIKYFRETLRHYRVIRSTGTSEQPCVRMVVYIVLMMIMVFISIAALINVACVQNHEVKQQALILKYMNPTQSNMHKIFGFAKYALMSHRGLSEADLENHPAGGLFMANGYIFKDNEGMHFISNQTLKSSENKLYAVINGTKTKLTHDQLVSWVQTGAVKRLSKNNDEYVFTPAFTSTYGYTDHSGFDEDTSNYHLTRFGVSPSDLDSKSVFGKVMSGEGESNPLEHLKALNNHTRLGGIAAAYIITVFEHGIRSTQFGVHTESGLDVNKVLESVMWCDTGLMFSYVIFFVFVIFVTLSSLMKIVWSAMHKPHNPKHHHHHHHHHESGEYKKMKNEEEDEYNMMSAVGIGGN